MKFYGIKQLYPRLSFLGKKLRAVLANSRPFTLLLPLVGGYFVIQTSLTHWVLPTPDPLKTAAALLALVLANAFGNNVNAIYDADIDQVNKPYRPIPSGILSEREASGATFLIGVIGWVLALFVSLTFWIFWSMLLIMTAFYSIPPLRLKRFLWINIAVQAFIRGVLGVLAVWTVYGTISVQALGMSAVLFLLIFAAQSSKDFVDVKGDRMYGIRTLPVVYGIQKTVEYTAVLLALPFFVTVFFVLVGVFPLTAVSLIILVPAALFFLHSLEKRSETLENSRGWAVFYGMMLAALGLFSLVL